MKKHADIKILAKFHEHIRFNVMKGFPITEHSNFATIAMLYVAEQYEEASKEEKKIMIKKFVELRLKAEKMGFLENSREIKTEVIDGKNNG